MIRSDRPNGAETTVRRPKSTEINPLGPASLWRLVELRADTDPDRVFLVDEFDRSLTYEQFRQAALRAAAGFAGLGVAAGDTVAWQLPTWIESVVTMGALARLGVRQLPLLPIYREAELSDLLARSGASLWCLPSLWRKTDYQPIVERVCEGSLQVRHLFCDHDLPDGDPKILPEFDGTQGDEVAWLFPTSGTTSAPKLVMHTDRSIMAGGAAFCRAQGLRKSDRYGIAFPITHIGGANNLAAALLGGYSLALTEAFDPAKTAASFRRNQVTIAGGGPVFYAAFLKEQRRREDGLSILPDLRFMTGGGAPMPSALHYAVRDEIGGVGCAHGYGMTEACIVSMNHPNDADERLATTVGRPTTGVEVRIVADGGPVAQGDQGEIQIRGEAVFRGYLGAQDSALDDDGWFSTGDLGHLDTDGYLHITGRLKDIIIRKGENVSAVEVEGILFSHPKVNDVAVIGLPDPDRGELVCAVVRPESGAAPTLDDLADHCAAAGLMTRKFPERLELMDDLPRNPAGKVLKNELRQRLVAVSSQGHQ
ncbi:class I adenylate-forming enzyme family protein [Dietzia sp. B32]|uniref:class I adenylate-forming enzyme family protein n=1 Tax=Dietzia sp. B32 TaxID=2915130 RepID=UPI0021ADC038|nr:class I adenylate-forming enzyme family protein [Dietzia sp. B32]UVE93807.1 acyl--CoA ligase [Dietzia sp. B32]